MEKSKKTCQSCETKYTISWDIEEQDLEPSTCPFCGHEVLVEQYDEIDDRHEEDDNWN